MITVAEEYYPYSKGEIKDGNAEPIVNRLFDLLPHGSGIDYTWYISQHKRQSNRFYAKNSYHAMDEFGGYCHTYDFTVIYDYHGNDTFVSCEYCEGTGKRYLSDFMHYHPNQTERELANWLELERDTQILHDNNGNYFVCNVCKGTGKNKLPEFELVKLNFHGQKESSCCGYGLKDYLYQVLDLID